MVNKIAGKTAKHERWTPIGFGATMEIETRSGLKLKSWESGLPLLGLDVVASGGDTSCHGLKDVAGPMIWKPGG